MAQLRRKYTAEVAALIQKRCQLQQDLVAGCVEQGAATAMLSALQVCPKTCVHAQAQVVCNSVMVHSFERSD